MEPSPYVLLPGLDGSGRLFDVLLSALPAGSNVTVVSYPTDGDQDYDTLTAYADQFLTDQPCVLVGESFSGPLAVRLAAARPSRVGALVLGASFVRPPRGDLLTKVLPLASAHWVPHFLIDYFMASPATPNSVLRTLHKLVRQTPAAILRARLLAVLRADVRVELRMVSCPILVLQAGADRLVPRAASRAIVAERPDATLSLVNAPHLMFQTAPEECALAIGEFLAAKRQIYP